MLGLQNGEWGTLNCNKKRVYFYLWSARSKNGNISSKKEVQEEIVSIIFLKALCVDLALNKSCHVD